MTLMDWCLPSSARRQPRRRKDPRHEARADYRNVGHRQELAAARAGCPRLPAVDTDYGGYYETAGGESLWLEDRISAAPAAVLTERLATRTTNPYGKDPAELAETLHYQQTVELLLRASATFEVVTTIPVTHVADLVLRHAGLPA
jgi:hypothetical protein